MKNTPISSVNFETSAFSRSALRDAIEKLEDKKIGSNLGLLKKTFREIFGFLSVLDANPKAAKLLADFVQSYRKTRSYPLSYRGFRSWSKTKGDDERKLLSRFKREVNGTFAAYTLLTRIKSEMENTK
tara:strand:- start:12211 stop:12594 length:384 start_codon:yes stop_codon:yes gene_type:complete